MPALSTGVRPGPLSDQLHSLRKAPKNTKRSPLPGRQQTSRPSSSTTDHKKSTFLPDIITTHLQKDPYTYQQQQQRGKIRPLCGLVGKVRKSAATLYIDGEVFRPTRQLARFFSPEHNIYSKLRFPHFKKLPSSE